MKFFVLFCSFVVISAAIYGIQAFSTNESYGLFAPHGGRLRREMTYPYSQYPCPDTNGSKHEACNPYCKRRSSYHTRGRCSFGFCRCRLRLDIDLTTETERNVTDPITPVVHSDLPTNETNKITTNEAASTTSTNSSIIVSD